jgi:hypothetical protein
VDSQSLGLTRPAPMQAAALATLSAPNDIGNASDKRLHVALALSKQLAAAYDDHQAKEAARIAYRDVQGNATDDYKALNDAAVKSADALFALARRVVDLRNKIAESCGSNLDKANHLRVGVDAWRMANEAPGRNCKNAGVASMAVRAHRLYVEAATGLIIAPSWLGNGYKLKGQPRSPQDLDMVSWIRAARMCGLSWEFGSEEGVPMRKLYPGLTLSQVTVTLDQLVAANMTRGELRNDSFASGYPAGIVPVCHQLLNELALRQLATVAQDALHGSLEGHTNFPIPLIEVVIRYVGEAPPEK